MLLRGCNACRVVGDGLQQGRCSCRRAGQGQGSRGIQERSGDLQLGITTTRGGPAPGHHGRQLSLVVVIKKLVQCTLLNSERRASRALAGTTSQDLAQTLSMGSLDTALWPGAKEAQPTCEVRHLPQVLDWAVAWHGGDKWLPDEQRAELVAAVQKTACKVHKDSSTQLVAAVQKTACKVHKDSSTQRPSVGKRLHRKSSV